MNFSERILNFYHNLKFPFKLGNEVEVMVPFAGKETWDACQRFYSKYYSDKRERRMIIGINPGRFGGGITGIPFTDPVRLHEVCNIENNWNKKQELSSVFIYRVIKEYGGPEKFYNDYYITSVSPLGFTKNNKNLNYYDDKELELQIKDSVVQWMQQQLNFGIKRDIAFCLGEGKNFKYLNKLNSEEKFFNKIIPLSHPRFIMQYKLKKQPEYIQDYINKLSINT